MLTGESHPFFSICQGASANPVRNQSNEWNEEAELLNDVRVTARAFGVNRRQLGHG